MSQPMQFDEREHGYQTSTPPQPLEHDYLAGYAARLDQQSSRPRFTRRSHWLHPATSFSWQQLVVALVSLLVLILLAYGLLALPDSYPYNYHDYGTRLIALVIISITIILINFLFKKR